MILVSENIANSTGEEGSPSFPEYPQFMLTGVPGLLQLSGRTQSGIPIVEQMTPTRVWQGVIVPFATDEEAKLALRLLAADLPIAVHGGTLRPAPHVRRMKPHAAEPRLINTDLIFDILVAEFQSPAHPWAFSLSPAILQRPGRHHPHLRSDRSLRLPSRELQALCVYSAAEFAFDPNCPSMPPFLDQVAIFLAKHVIWLKTQRLFDQNGVMIHDGIDMSTIMSKIPPDSVWQRVPITTTHWIGFWPGSAAANGAAHIRLNPERECWCGKGKLYKNCCLEWERAAYLR
jgi:hypothetical protein